MNGDETLKTVFIMWHVRKNDEYVEDAKLIGAYRDRNDCEAAIERLKDKPGFRDYLKGFQIVEYALNQDHWEEGFIGDEEANRWRQSGPLKSSSIRTSLTSQIWSPP